MDENDWFFKLYLFSLDDPIYLHLHLYSMPSKNVTVVQTPTLSFISI